MQSAGGQLFIQRRPELCSKAWHRSTSTRRHVGTHTHTYPNQYQRHHPIFICSNYTKRRIKDLEYSLGQSPSRQKEIPRPDLLSFVYGGAGKDEGQTRRQCGQRPLSFVFMERKGSWGHPSFQPYGGKKKGRRFGGLHLGALLLSVSVLLYKLES